MGDRGTRHDSETLRRSTAAVMVYREKVWPGLRVELVLGEIRHRHLRHHRQDRPAGIEEARL